MSEGNGFVMKDDEQDKEPTAKTAFQVDFSSFILSIYSSALVQLGKVEDPTTGEKAKNIDYAKQTIDIIAVLKDKTEGNLDTDEEELMKTLLQELRIIYVEEK